MSRIYRSSRHNKIITEFATLITPRKRSGYGIDERCDSERYSGQMSTDDAKNSKHTAYQKGHNPTNCPLLLS